MDKTNNMKELLVEIKDLECKIGDQEILKGVNLQVNKGEVHAIMGPNGSGKSTLSSVLAGNDNYEITEGSISFLGEDITEMSPEERSWKGMFLAFQYPIEIPGVSNINFLRTALNERNKFFGDDPIPAKEARDFLNNLVTNKEVSIRRITKDRYGRTVAELIKDKTNIQQLLVQKNLAKVYKRYKNQCLWSI